MTDKIKATADRVESNFEYIENEIFNGEMFSKWRGSFEVKKVYVKKENADIKCDLDIRLGSWPEGVSIKAYKHKALGVFAYLKDELVCEKYLNIKAVPCKYWRDSFYFSRFENLDQDRYVLLEGNDMKDTETKLCLEKIKAHLEEISLILSDQ